MQRSKKQSETELWVGLKAPALPAGLKQRTLARARRAVHSQPLFSDRLWENRRLRLAWASAIVLLCGAHLYLAGPLALPAAGQDRQPPGELDAVEPDLAPFLARYSTEDFSGSQPLRFPMFFLPFYDFDEIS